MNRTSFSLLLIAFMMACLPSSLRAQSKGDALFAEGLELQKTMTVSSQNAAIRKFQSAKVVYTSSEKKKKCDSQIGVCNKNIKNIKAQNSSAKKKSAAREEAPKEEEKVKEPEPAPVEISLAASPDVLEFACNPKGRTQTIKVDCNVEWKVVSHPDWVEIYTSEGKCNVLALENESGDKRSGVITIQAGEKQALIVVNQKITLVKRVKKALDR